MPRPHNTRVKRVFRVYSNDERDAQVVHSSAVAARRSTGIVSDLDRDVLVGAGIFGVGWGVSGIYPGAYLQDYWRSRNDARTGTPAPLTRTRVAGVPSSDRTRRAARRGLSVSRRRECRRYRVEPSPVPSRRLSHRRHRRNRIVPQYCYLITLLYSRVRTSLERVVPFRSTGRSLRPDPTRISASGATADFTPVFACAIGDDVSVTRDT